MDMQPQSSGAAALRAKRIDVVRWQQRIEAKRFVSRHPADG
jgi:hypothetical protein